MGASGGGAWSCTAELVYCGLHLLWLHSLRLRLPWPSLLRPCSPRQALRMEEDESLELWYLLCCAALQAAAISPLYLPYISPTSPLLCCAALQASELDLAAAEAAAALEFAASEACPEDEKEWMGQLRELQADIAEAAAAAPQ